MKILKRILIGLISLLAIIFAGGYGYLKYTAPDYSGAFSLPGLQQSVEVLYDDYGVPHIYAQNEQDAYFALGYVHAQDRLFQMEMLRRAAGGRLAEILGEELLPVDKLFRTLGINQFAKEHAQRFLLSDTSAFQRAALSYQKGINQYIRSGKTPVEFTLIGIPKEEFTPQDIYLAIGFMSFGFAEGLRADPVLQKIKTEYGDSYLTDFSLATPPDAETIKNYQGPVKNSQTGPLIAFFQDALGKIPVPLWSGSNGWVVSGDRTTSGLPILANDTHIGFGQPSVWYEAHIEYPGFSFYGHHIAGIPFGLLGNNRYAAWGLTMFENDDADFFIETVNPENPDQVKFKDQWENLSVRKEVINIKDKPPVELEIKSSRHGSLINKVIDHTPADRPVALSWLVTQQTNRALQAAYLLNHSSRFAEAQEAASMFSAPGLNLMYGDTDGNIAWWACAQLPIRPAHVQSKLFLDGASGHDEYLGFYDFSKNPHAVNPPWGFVYSANNQPDSVDGVLYPGYYYPKARAGRIVELLSKERTWTPQNMKEINLDVVSGSAVEVAKEMAAVLSSLQKSEFTPLVDLLSTWDGDHKKTDRAPSVYYNMLTQIYYLSMQDEIGAEALQSILLTSVPKNAIGFFVRNNESPWWDNVKTETKETRSIIFEQAAYKTLSLLQNTCGEKPEDWVWGKIHTLKHNHPLGVVKAFDKLFSVGPFEVDGGNEVLNNLHFKLDTTGYFHVDGGPALRKITDLANLQEGETVSPTGQSGNVMSRFYSDQAAMFATGKFRKMWMNRKAIEAVSQHKLMLNPLGR